MGHVCVRLCGWVGQEGVCGCGGEATNCFDKSWVCPPGSHLKCVVKILLFCASRQGKSDRCVIPVDQPTPDQTVSNKSAMVSPTRPTPGASNDDLHMLRFQIMRVGECGWGKRAGDSHATEVHALTPESHVEWERGTQGIAEAHVDDVWHFSMHMCHVSPQRPGARASHCSMLS